MKKRKKDTGTPLSLDIFLMSMSWEEYRHIQHRIRPAIRKNHPLLSWDIASGSDTNQQHEQAKLLQLSAKYGWTTPLPDLHDFHYQCIVVTDASQHILWVSSGFRAMTGYTARYAKGRTPAFLQGPDTSGETRAGLRHAILNGRPFQGTLLNYRNSGEPYLCHLQIFPAGNPHRITHFIALEKEII